MRRDRFPLLRIVFGTWRRFLPSPGHIVGAMFTPRRLLRRFRLRWLVLFLGACLVWLAAVLTEPVSPESRFASPGAERSAAAGDGPGSDLAGVAGSPEAASRFFRKVAHAVRTGIETGHVELSITDKEATSVLEIGARLVEIRQVMSTLSPEELEALDTPEEVRRTLDARAAEPPSDVWDRVRTALNPRLRFRQAHVRFIPDGRVVVSGYAQAWSRGVRLYMDGVPTLRDGRLHIEFGETRLGRLRVPSWVLSGPTDLLTLILGLGRDYAGLETLSVGDGSLTMSGRVRLPRER